MGRPGGPPGGRGLVRTPRCGAAAPRRRALRARAAAAPPPLSVQLSALSQHRRLKDPKVQLFTDYMAGQIRDDLRRVG